MADSSVYARVEAAYAAVDHARAVFPTLCLAEGVAHVGQGLAIAASLSADDGGRFLLRLSGDSSARVDMVMAEGDGGLPPAFIDDLNNVCFDCDLSEATVVDPGSCSGGCASLSDSAEFPPLGALDHALRTVLLKAANLYEKMNGTGLDEVDPAAESLAAASAAALKRSQKSRTAVVYNTPNFSSSPLATATLTKQLNLISKQDTKALGFTVEPIDEDLYVWRAKLFFRDMAMLLARDLESHPTEKHVTLEFRFPNDYPMSPPFCRVVSPCFISGTGYVQPHGGLCMELLTGAGWTPANSMDSVLIQLHSFLIAGGGRLDLSNLDRIKGYTFENAIRDFSSIVRAHGWDAANGLEPMVACLTDVVRLVSTL
jgi:ubiquitin-protein ligase